MKYSRPLYSIDNLIFDSNTKSYNYISQRERLLEVLVASGTFTRVNSRLSLVDGTAFFDCGADLSAYAGLDSGSHEYLIKVYDDDGNAIQGYVGAVGGGEAFGGEELTNYDFTGTWGVNDLPQGWDLLGVPDVNHYLTKDDANDRLQIVSDDALMGVRQSVLTNKILYKYSLNIQTMATGDGKLYIGKTDFPIRLTSSGLYTGYVVVDSSPVQLTRWNSCNYITNSLSVKPLTDCAATGFHIISAQGGSTQNWTSESASFNYNDTAGYTFKLYKVR